MKKLILVVFILFFIITVFSQEYFVTDYDGNTWLSFTQKEKATYISGYFTAMSCIQGMANFVDTVNPSEEIIQYSNLIREWSTYTMSLEEVIQNLDSIYINIETRQFKIWDVLLVLYNKEWW